MAHDSVITIPILQMTYLRGGALWPRCYTSRIQWIQGWNPCSSGKSPCFQWHLTITSLLVESLPSVLGTQMLLYRTMCLEQIDSPGVSRFAFSLITSPAFFPELTHIVVSQYRAEVQRLCWGIFFPPCHLRSGLGTACWNIYCSQPFSVHWTFQLVST